MSRTERYAALYSENAPINDQELTPDRYAVVTRQETTGERWIITSDDVKTACNLAAGDVLDGWIPEEIVDLDTGRYGSLEVVVQLTGWTADVYCSGCGDPIIEVDP